MRFAPTITARLSHPLVHCGVIVLLAALAYLPRLKLAFFDDLPHHHVWLRAFTEAVISGTPYPRWLPSANAGLGSPAFYAYAPLPYWLALPFFPLLKLDTTGWALLYAAGFAAYTASGLACYRLCRFLSTPGVALAAALIYLVNPYHLVVNTYMRFAYAELWAMAWLPLILHAMLLTARNKGQGWVSLACWWGALLLTHPPTALLAAPFLALLGLAWSGGSIVVLVRYAVATLAGTGLAAVYLVPMALLSTDLHLSHVLLQSTASAVMLFSSNSMDHILPLTGMLTVLLFAVLLVPTLTRLQQLRGIIYPSLIACALLLVLMSPLANEAWQHMALLRAVALPWRGIALLSLLATLIFAITCMRVRALPWIGVALSLAATLGTGALSLRYQATPATQALYNETFLPQRIQHGPEYFPIGVPESLIHQPKRIAELGMKPLAVLHEGKGGVQVAAPLPTAMLLRTTCTTPCTIALRPFSFPTWQLDGTAATKLAFSKETGQLMFTAPTGEHSWVLRTAPHPSEREAAIITLLSIALLSWATWRARISHD